MREAGDTKHFPPRPNAQKMTEKVAGETCSGVESRCARGS